MTENGIVIAVNRSSIHSFSKSNQESIHLLAGQGVEEDAHIGETVQHLSRVKKDPHQLRAKGFDVSAGQMGENITTCGIDLLDLPTGTRLRLGNEAVVELTGLRNPCYQLNDFQPGLMAAVLDHDETGNFIRKAGVMSIVLVSGVVKPGDMIQVELPPQPHNPLKPV
jgi:MOSC domain-containing protein YiiM